SFPNSLEPPCKDSSRAIVKKCEAPAGARSRAGPCAAGGRSLLRGRRRRPGRGRLGRRQREEELASLARLRLRPDPAAVLLDDLLDHGKADARARILL